MVRRDRIPPSWEEVEAALARAREATDELATTEGERAQRRFGLVMARMELKKLFEGGEGDVVQGGRQPGDAPEGAGSG